MTYTATGNTTGFALLSSVHCLVMFLTCDCMKCMKFRRAIYCLSRKEHCVLEYGTKVKISMIVLLLKLSVFMMSRSPDLWPTERMSRMLYCHHFWSALLVWVMCLLPDTLHNVQDEKSCALLECRMNGNVRVVAWFLCMPCWMTCMMCLWPDTVSVACRGWCIVGRKWRKSLFRLFMTLHQLSNIMTYSDNFPLNAQPQHVLLTWVDCICVRRRTCVFSQITSQS